ncbi:MAG: amidohydrolase family protein [Marmoricola sp.]
MSTGLLALRAPVVFDGVQFTEGGATVMVRDGRVVGVEAFGFDVPDGCEVQSFPGTILPGLFDAHVHLVSDGSPGALERAGEASDEELDQTIADSLRTQVRAGVTTVRDLGDRGYRTLVARDHSSPGLPRVLAAGPPLTLLGGHCHYLGGAVQGADQIRSAVAERSERRVDVVKVMASGGFLTAGTDMFGAQFEPSELRVLVDSCHDAGLRVLAHAHSLAGIEHALSAGVDGIEHFTGLTEAGVQVSDELLRRTAEAGVTVDPTLGFDQSVLARMPEPPPHVREAMRRTGMDFESLTAARLTLAGRFREHGVRIVSGVDSGAMPMKPHGTAFRAITELVEAGYPVAEALRTATSIAAQECGLSEVTGSLRAGLAADVLVVDGDVEHEPSALGRPVLVLVGGVPAA